MALLGNKQDLTGGCFGRLKVIKNAGRNKHGKVLWECVCNCGKTTITLGQYLKSGDTKSCGCLGRTQLGESRKKHGLSHKKNSEYEIWKGMKARCYNQNHVHFKNYGGRGIAVSERWKDSFENFIEDMGLKPSPKHSLDRYPDFDGNYEKKNCRWATNYQQARNKRTNRFFEFENKIMILEDWADFFEVDQSTLHEHLKTKDFSTIYAYYAKKLKTKS